MWKSAIAIVVVIAAIVGVRYIVSEAENPSALWTIVQSCVAFQQQGHAPPGPCTYVDLNDEVAVLKSFEGRWQFLAVPTVRVTGIEDPQVLMPRLPNYWALAWIAAQRVLPAAVTANRNDVGLAINSVEGRSQNQLHIHISCVQPSVMHELNAMQNQIGTSWSKPLPLGEHAYSAMRVEAATLENVDPFFLLLKLKDARQHMGEQTLVVVGATWDGGKKRGFYILDDYTHETSDGPDLGHGEGLLDEDCGAALSAHTHAPSNG